jgi:hypothetical protein
VRDARRESIAALWVTVVMYAIGLSLRSPLPAISVPSVGALAAAITMCWVATYRVGTLWMLGAAPGTRLLAALLWAAVFTYHIVYSRL